MRRAVSSPKAFAGPDGAAFYAWLAAVRRVLRFPALDLSVTLPAQPAPDPAAQPSIVDLWRNAVIAGREAKARGDTRAQHDAAEAAKRYAQAQLEGRL